VDRRAGPAAMARTRSTRQPSVRCGASASGPPSARLSSAMSRPTGSPCAAGSRPTSRSSGAAGC
jgi:hypothetical protein